MRFLVIGGTGFIGSHIVQQLAGQEHEVAVYHRGRKNVALPRGVREFVNRSSAWPIEIFPSELFEFEPQVVVHTVAMSEADAKAAVSNFDGRASRLVMLSSGDVYRAYGRLIGLESGPAEYGLLSEDAPLRTVLFPYRQRAASQDSLEYWYEKIIAERVILSSPNLLGTVLRLPKVYGPGSNQDLATVYCNRYQPHWRWTHGYVENVAAAIVLAATDPRGASNVYNVGEEYTPTISERLAWMPDSPIGPVVNDTFDYTQDIAYDTSRIRRELGYKEVISEYDAILRTLALQ